MLAKLLHIDYELIIGLPFIRKLESIQHLPSLFLNENIPSIGESAGPCEGVALQLIRASYAESGLSNKNCEVVITDPPFSHFLVPSGTLTFANNQSHLIPFWKRVSIEP